MYQVTPEEAKSRLDELLAAALHGERVVIVADATHSVQLVPALTVRKRRKAGSAKGLISLGEDFDAPLADFDEYMR